MIHYGVSFFMLEKLAVVGISNLHIYAAMRGETLEQFQQTRNAPGALYQSPGRRRPLSVLIRVCHDGTHYPHELGLRPG